MNAPDLIFAYFGPETVLPMTSIVATVVGLVMMFGKNTFRLLFRWRKFRREVPQPDKAMRPPQYVRSDAAQVTAERR